MVRTTLALVLCAMGAVAEDTVALPGGATLAVRLEHAVNAAHAHPGDPVEATLLAPLLSHGAILVPKNARISGRVLAAVGRRKGSDSRLIIRFEWARWGGAAMALNAYTYRQLAMRNTVTSATGNNPCPSISRFDFFQRRDRDPATLPQVPKISPMPCEGRIGTTTIAEAPQRTVFVSPPLKNMRLQSVAERQGRPSSCRARRMWCCAAGRCWNCGRRAHKRRPEDSLPRARPSAIMRGK